MARLTILIVITAKFLLPLLIFRLPFQVSWANFLLDTVDGDVLMHFGLPYETYSLIDKTADYITYVVMFLVGSRWQIGKTITFLFIYRTVGQAMFFVTGNDLFLFFFPNLLEPLFMAYSLLLFIDRKKAHERYRKYLVPIWMTIIVFKMWNEYNVHVGHIDLSEKYLGINN